MKRNKLKLLFVSHDASLTGAPILLLHLLDLINKGKEYDIKVLIKVGEGTLISKFSEFGECIIWKKKDNRLLKKIINRGLSKFSLQNEKEKYIQKIINESDIVFSNTITNGDFFKAFNFPSRLKIISYIHELELATSFFTNPQDLNFVQKLTTHFLVPSKAVADHLNQNLKISFDKIDFLNYFIPEFSKRNDEKDYYKDEFIIGIAGTLDWRKGADVFSILVSDFFRKYPDLNVKFIWKGVNQNTIEFKRISLEFQKLNIAEKVSLENASKQMDEFYNKIDVFLLLSKEDPYPLVVLEAASANKPCICFAGAGGAAEFVEDDAGDIVPYLDIGQLSNVIFKYYLDRDMLLNKGKNANLKLKRLHQDDKFILSQFYNVLSKI